LWQAYTVPDLTLSPFLITKSKKAAVYVAVGTWATVSVPVSTTVFSWLDNKAVLTITSPAKVAFKLVSKST